MTIDEWSKEMQKAIKLSQRDSYQGIAALKIIAEKTAQSVSESLSLRHLDEATGFAAVFQEEIGEYAAAKESFIAISNKYKNTISGLGLFLGRRLAGAARCAFKVGEYEEGIALLRESLVYFAKYEFEYIEGHEPKEAVLDSMLNAYLQAYSPPSASKKNSRKKRSTDPS